MDHPTHLAEKKSFTHLRGHSHFRDQILNLGRSAEVHWRRDEPWLGCMFSNPKPKAHCGITIVIHESIAAFGPSSLIHFFFLECSCPLDGLDQSHSPLKVLLSWPKASVLSLPSFYLQASSSPLGYLETTENLEEPPYLAKEASSRLSSCAIYPCILPSAPTSLVPGTVYVYVDLNEM